jgi:hypothetical protein
MFKFFVFIFMIFFSIYSKGQTYSSLQENDTTKYELVSSMKDFEEFGYNYADKNVLIQGFFQEISNNYLSSAPDVKIGSSREGFSTYYNSKKIKELVGIRLCEGQYTRNILFCTEIFYRLYGYQKDILEKLRQLPKDAPILVFGKVVKYDNGEDYGIRMKYIYTVDEYNTALGVVANTPVDNVQSDSTTTEQTTTSSTAKKDKNWSGILVLSLIIYSLFGWWRKKKKNDNKG